MSASNAGAITWRWVKKHQVYLAATTHLRGVVGRGPTIEEALAALQEAIHSHAEATRSEGIVRCLPQPEPAGQMETWAG